MNGFKLAINDYAERDFKVVWSKYLNEMAILIASLKPFIFVIYV